MNKLPSELVSDGEHGTVQERHSNQNSMQMIPINAHLSSEHEKDKIKNTGLPDLNVPQCEIHRPGCVHWPDLDVKEKKANATKYSRSIRVS